MESPLHHACTLSNDGVALLQQSDLGGSIRLFQQALTVLQECVILGDGCCHDDTSDPSMTVQPPPSTHSVTTPTASSHPRPSCGAWLPSFIEQSSQNLSNISPSSGGSGYFLYNRPFFIVPEMLPTSSQSQPYDNATVDLVGCHVLFNFALAWQQHAEMLGCDSSSRHTNDLYDILLQIAHQRNDLRYAQAFTALSCLVFNNLAHLHHEQCCYKESSMCIDIMLTMLRDTQGLDDYLHPQELSSMVWNAVHNQPPTMASAA
jgi:hypothetical protein